MIFEERIYSLIRYPLYGWCRCIFKFAFQLYQLHTHFWGCSTGVLTWSFLLNLNF